MTQDEIIDMWHSANCVKIKGAEYDVVVTFAQLVARHTLSNIDPSKFMSYQEGMEAGRLAEREACAKFIENCSLPDSYSEPCLVEFAKDIRAGEHT